MPLRSAVPCLTLHKLALLGMYTNWKPVLFHEMDSEAWTLETPHQGPLLSKAFQVSALLPTGPYEWRMRMSSGPASQLISYYYMNCEALTVWSWSFRPRQRTVPHFLGSLPHTHKIMEFYTFIPPMMSFPKPENKDRSEPMANSVGAGRIAGVPEVGPGWCFATQTLVLDAAVVKRVADWSTGVLDCPL